MRNPNWDNIMVKAENNGTAIVLHTYERQHGRSGGFYIITEHLQKWYANDPELIFHDADGVSTIKMWCKGQTCHIQISWLHFSGEWELRGHVQRFTIDLNTRSIRLGDMLLLDHGVPTSVTPRQELICFEGDPYAEIERLYAQFKRSVPVRMERVNKGYFKALSSDALTMEELENNLPRIEARIRLEAFICLASCAGLIPWHIPRHFFWRGNDPDCIIYRNWILKEETTNE